MVGTPFRAGGDYRVRGILRLRMCFGFADAHASLRMTEWLVGVDVGEVGEAGERDLIEPSSINKPTTSKNSR